MFRAIRRVSGMGAGGGDARENAVEGGLGREEVVLPRNGVAVARQNERWIIGC